MDWLSWSLNGVRDLLLVVVGAGMAWLAGASAARSTARIEREKREAADAVDRRQAVQRETRRALALVHELEILAEQGEAHRPNPEVKIPDDTRRELRRIADVLPDARIRRTIGDFFEVFGAWELLSGWAKLGDRLEINEYWYQRQRIVDLRQALSAAARGDDPSMSDLEELGAHRLLALEAKWG